MTDMKECVICGELFARREGMNAGLWQQARYCSTQCKNRANYLNRTGTPARTAQDEYTMRALARFMSRMHRNAAKVRSYEARRMVNQP